MVVVVHIYLVCTRKLNLENILSGDHCPLYRPILMISKIFNSYNSVQWADCWIYRRFRILCSGDPGLRRERLISVFVYKGARSTNILPIHTQKTLGEVSLRITWVKYRHGKKILRISCIQGQLSHKPRVSCGPRGWVQNPVEFESKHTG